MAMSSLEEFRAELLAYAYRMTGSIHDAEDVVQEAYLRAWRGRDGYEGRAGERTWLYRITTNVCLTQLRGRAMRPLPSGLGPPGGDPDAEPVVDLERAWLEPISDDRWGADPAERAARRDSVRLAVVAGLQYLPPRQRAALVLCDVLSFSPAEAAEMLGTTAVSIKGLSARARTRLDKHRPALDAVVMPSDAESRSVLDRYVDAFERSDLAALERLLTDDAVLEMPPSRTWFAGKATCLAYLRHVLYAPGDWALFPVGANGLPAAAVYLQGQGLGVSVLEPRALSLARICLFGDPTLLTHFGLPERKER
jgi:RNA polymerase sigma-70 factor, ECF subfamily